MIKVYEREHNNRYTYGMSSEEVMEAMKMYTEYTYNKIFEEFEQEGQTSLSPELRGIISHFMDKAFTEGMELAHRPYSLAEFYKEQKQIKLNEIQDYEFCIDLGVSGILFPDGKFVKCGNAQHHLLTKDMSVEEQFDCIYFSSLLNEHDQQGNISHSPVGFKGITDTQRQWIKDNYWYLDESQRNMYKLKFEEG